MKRNAGWSSATVGVSAPGECHERDCHGVIGALLGLPADRLRARRAGLTVFCPSRWGPFYCHARMICVHMHGKAEEDSSTRRRRRSDRWPAACHTDGLCQRGRWCATPTHPYGAVPCEPRVGEHASKSNFQVFLALQPTQPWGPSSTGHGRVQQAQVLTGDGRRSRAILAQVSS